MEQRKILLAYYSRTGTTKKVAEAIAGQLKCDTEEIQDVRSRKGLFGWLRSGREAMRKVLPPIRETTRDPGQYDLVIVGSPVWASTMASPIRTWLDRHKPELINTVALFCTSGGADSGHTLPDMGMYCPCDSLANAVFLRRDVEAGRLADRVSSFIAALNR
jgi:flavodoxin